LGCHREGQTAYLINVASLGYFNSPSSVVDNFDFSVCKAVYNLDSEEFYFDDNFFVDLAARRLSIGSGTRFPLMSVIRTKKYLDRGFTISRNESLKSLLMVSKLDLSTLEECKKHINGLYGS